MRREDRVGYRRATDQAHAPVGEQPIVYIADVKQKLRTVARVTANAFIRIPNDLLRTLEDLHEPKVVCDEEPRDPVSAVVRLGFRQQLAQQRVLFHAPEIALALIKHPDQPHFGSAHSAMVHCAQFKLR